jgi:hypothetical protein
LISGVGSSSAAWRYRRDCSHKCAGAGMSPSYGISSVLIAGAEDRALRVLALLRKASRACNSHRSATSKSLRRSAGSAVRSATSRSSTTFSSHHVAGDTSVSVIMTFPPLLIARVAVNYGKMRSCQRPAAYVQAGVRAAPCGNGDIVSLGRWRPSRWLPASDATIIR